jgi:hypothetical protein
VHLFRQHFPGGLASEPVISQQALIEWLEPLSSSDPSDSCPGSVTEELRCIYLKESFIVYDTLKRFSIGLGVDYLRERFGTPTEVYITQRTGQSQMTF